MGPKHPVTPTSAAEENDPRCSVSVRCVLGWLQPLLSCLFLYNGCSVCSPHLGLPGQCLLVGCLSHGHPSVPQMDFIRSCDIVAQALGCVLGFPVKLSSDKIQS